LNWRENEFTIDVQPGSSVNTPARIVTIKNPPPHLQIINELTTSSSDGEPSLYFSLVNSNIGYLRGTVSLNAPSDFNLRCAVPNSALYAADELTQALRAQGIEIEQEAIVKSNGIEKTTVLDVHRSPPLSKLIQPFLRISINMYGEVFVKTIAYETQQCSLTNAPLTILPSYIKTLLDDNNLLTAVAIADGSGLSRSNRLSTHALAQTLFKVQKEPWFDEYHEAFPTINELRMKSGTLMNTVAYAGYIRENSYVFSFMINNYYGETAVDMRKKIWSVLDTLK
jgi:D-alanyl-D-alanine carboxypeptidase/D-alanyl-D-alanine-endopeptidase (penicillin-binding protein 4)